MLSYSKLDIKISITKPYFKREKNQKKELRFKKKTKRHDIKGVVTKAKFQISMSE